MLFQWPSLSFSNPLWLAGLLIVPAIGGWTYRHGDSTLRPGSLVLLALRSLMLALLFLALSGPVLKLAVTQPFVVFLSDSSHSLDATAAKTAGDFVAASLNHTGLSDYRILRFAKSVWQEPENAPPSIPPRAARQHSGTEVARLRAATDIAAALQAAAACIPADRPGKIVLLSDGRETSGDARTTAKTLSAPVWVVPLTSGTTPEVAIAALNAPAEIAPGEPFEVELIVESRHTDTVHLEISAGEQTLVSEDRLVSAGSNRFRFAQRIQNTTRFTAVIRSIGVSQESAENSATGTVPTTDFRSIGDANAADNLQPESGRQPRDTWTENNSASATVTIGRPPRVLMVQSIPDADDALMRALRSEGFEVTAAAISDLPATALDLHRWQTLILSNVAATDLQPEQMQAIRHWVANFGGGLIVAGGPQSFGPGGYYQTVLEDMLPVASDFQKQQEKPSLGMFLVIDKSGSMGGSKIELAKDAAKAAVELLGEEDQTGIVAFDGAPWVVSEPSTLRDRASILRRIAAVEVGGGTNLYPAMKLALDSLKSMNTRLKHLIILTDGYSIPGDFESLTQEFAAEKITISTVGIGDADPQLLKSIADAGRGRNYLTNDATMVPQIFARETFIAGQDALREDPVVPQLHTAAEALADIDFQNAPPLLGYVVTRLKPRAQLILRTDDGIPVLAWWRYGLGTTAAFSSDTGWHWGLPWTSWEAYSRFWAQLVRYCVPSSRSSLLDIQVERQPQGLNLVMHGATADGRPLNNAAPRVQGVSAQGTSFEAVARQTGPGRYEVLLPDAEGGDWQLQVVQSHEGRSPTVQTLSLNAPMNPEYQLQATDSSLLRAVADVSGGRFGPRPDEVFEIDAQHSAIRLHALDARLLMLALLLLPVDVAFRRLPVLEWLGRLRRGAVHK